MSVRGLLFHAERILRSLDFLLRYFFPSLFWCHACFAFTYIYLGELSCCKAVLFLPAIVVATHFFTEEHFLCVHAFKGEGINHVGPIRSEEKSLANWFALDIQICNLNRFQSIGKYAAPDFFGFGKRGFVKFGDFRSCIRNRASVIVPLTVWEALIETNQSWFVKHSQCFPMAWARAVIEASLNILFNQSSRILEMPCWPRIWDSRRCSTC